MRMLVIGLDGVCISNLTPMMEDGIIPNLEAIWGSSAVGSLESQLPPWTPSAWPSMYTGVNPGKHGVYGFLNFEGYEWDVVNRSHVQEFAVWELLSMYGFSSVVLNVPTTYPPEEFDGVLVPGYLAPENPETHPPHVWSELNRELDEYSIYANTLDSSASDQLLADDLVRLTQMRGEAFRYLLNEYDPDFGFVQFQSTDTVYHEFPGDEAVIRRVYDTVDREVGAILDVCDPDVTLVISDHGIGPIEGSEFRVNDFLYERGFVVKTAAGNGMPSWKSITRRENDRPVAAADQLLATTLKLAAHIGITSQRIGAVLRRLGLENWVLKMVPVDLVRAGTEQVDFPLSTAYMRERTEMGIRINLEGREPDGVVPTEAYEKVRTALIEELEQVATPGGDRVFEDIFRRENVFDGPYLEGAPDIVTVPNRFDHFLVATLKGGLFGAPTEPWEHKRDGLIMALGDDIESDTDLEHARLIDIAPTVLAVFGLPVGERLDGNPLPIADPTDRIDFPVYDRTDSVRIDDTAVVDRLSNLGYLE